jgi:hypothetical protein
MEKKEFKKYTYTGKQEGYQNIENIFYLCDLKDGFTGLKSILEYALSNIDKSIYIYEENDEANVPNDVIKIEKCSFKALTDNKPSKNKVEQYIKVRNYTNIKNISQKQRQEILHSIPEDELINSINSRSTLEKVRISSKLDTQSDDCEIVINDSNVLKVAQAIIDKGIKLEEVSKLLEIKKMQDAITEFRQKIDNNETTESQFQAFFKKNQWILGHASEYYFLQEIKEQIPVKDSNAESKAGYNECDFKGLTQSRYAVLVEIKKPNTPIIGKQRNNTEEYYPVSLELSQAISQLQYYLHCYPHKSGIKEKSVEDNFSISNTRGVLVVGKKPTNKQESNSFELFRNDLHSIDVLTYDELCERAENILNNLRII